MYWGWSKFLHKTFHAQTSTQFKTSTGNAIRRLRVTWSIMWLDASRSIKINHARNLMYKFSQKRCQGAKLCSCVLLFDCSLSHICSKGSSSVIIVFMLYMSFHIFVKQGSDMHMHTYLEFFLHQRDCKSVPNVLPLLELLLKPQSIPFFAPLCWSNPRIHPWCQDGPCT